MIKDKEQTIVITGIGCWTGLGNVSQSWHQLLARNSSIVLQQPFPELPPYPLSLIQDQPLSLAVLTPSIVNAALADATLKPPLPDCGIVVGSSRGCQGDIEKIAKQKGELVNWLEILPHQSAIATAQMVGSNSMVLSPMAACSTGICAIAQGYELIQTGQCEQVMAGAVETPVTPLTLAGFAQMGALAKTGCYPFDTKREGLVLGEGGAVFMLESLASAQSRNAHIYGEIAGFGLTCDAYHVSAPDPNYRCASLAVKKSLEMSGITASEINYIHAHGTSTQLNDAREAQLIQSLFPRDVAVSSTKGATGHTLGASGAIALAFTLMALQTQTLPPCVGLRESEFDLNLVKHAMPSEINAALILSFGFGGQNGAIIVRR
ncbi:MAG: beta-ketoacyl-ACP synthase [Cyanobacteria bacterium]|jgi:3-oxoacyl-[acyl-carrier-protein] synthase II|nr:beta-ketoacyl-ACP synthase [Cyanobacteria bacterium GSL.Bin1]